MKERNIVIIGGGASGLVAAIVAARQGAKVTVLEKLASVGKKILATGNGRCNMTNAELGMHHFHSSDPTFFRPALEVFGFEKTIAFFHEIGVETLQQKSTKIFPLSLQASSVVDLLRDEAQNLGVAIHINSEVSGLTKTEKGFVVVVEGAPALDAEKVLIATGGKAAAHLGSDGAGYKLAKVFGHTITPLFPTLVQLRSNAKYLKKISGVKFEGTMMLLIDGEEVQRETGDILFTDYGVSGNTVIDISRNAAKALEEKRLVKIRMNLMPMFDRKALDAMMLRRFENRPKKSLTFSMVGLVNKKLAPIIVNETIGEDKMAAHTSKKERLKLVDFMQNWELEITGTQEFKRAEATAGGIRVDEVDAQTMESKKIKGLYLAGEVLDVDGDCGGYNLQWAWSSGYLAGLSMAR